MTHPIRARGYGSWVVVLALLLVGCRSSSAGAPRMDGDAVDGTDGEGDAALEEDAPVGDAGDDVGAPDGEVADGGGVDGDDRDARVVADRELCAVACAVAAGVVDCPVPLARCMTQCDRQFARGICLAALRTLLQCQTEAGPESYDCVSGGVNMKAGVCAAEQQAKVDCESGDAGT